MTMTMTALVDKILAKRDGARAPLRIVQAGHPALRANSRPVADDLPPTQLAELIEAMVITMVEAPGVGVAAPQVGLPVRLVVMADQVDEDDDADGDDPYERRTLPLMAVLNPRYERVKGEDTVTYGWEGCLSVDGWRSLVPRPKVIRALGTVVEPDGSRRELDEILRGWPARIFQHEADHLDGVLCHDLGVPRSLVQDRYQGYYTELTEAVHYLGLAGEVSTLDEGEVDVTQAPAPDTHEENHG